MAKEKSKKMTKKEEEKLNEKVEIINCKNFGGINQIESIILSVLSIVPIPITSKTLSKLL